MTPEDMQERDIVEFTDDNGNTLMLEVMDYFYYNGQEFAALCNANENPGDDDPDDDAVYIMQVNTFEDENGEIDEISEEDGGIRSPGRSADGEADSGGSHALFR